MTILDARTLYHLEKERAQARREAKALADLEAVKRAHARIDREEAGGVPMHKRKALHRISVGKNAP